MLEDTLLEIGCICCKGLSIKGMWQIRSGLCPLCNPAHRGGSIRSISSNRRILGSQSAILPQCEYPSILIASPLFDGIDGSVL